MKVGKRGRKWMKADGTTGVIPYKGEDKGFIPKSYAPTLKVGVQRIKLKNGKTKVIKHY